MKKTLEMKGPYLFTRDIVNKMITKKTFGNYALGYVNDNSTFIVKYVGRSDTDLKKRILDHIDEGYSKFKYSYATSSKAAFEKECKNYHDFGEWKLDNSIHPDRPSNSKSWSCPVCDVFDE